MVVSTNYPINSVSPRKALWHLAGFSFISYSSISVNQSNSMAKQAQLIQLKNKATGEVYWTRKNKKLVERKIELKKYSAKLRKHVVFKEAKK